jgi:hypothetical protein
MVNLDEFKYAGTNLTAFRLLDPDREEVKHVVDDWIYGEMRYGRKLDTPDQSIKVGQGLRRGVGVGEAFFDLCRCCPEAGSQKNLS